MGSNLGLYLFLVFVGFRVWALIGMWYIVGMQGFWIRGPYYGPMVLIMALWSHMPRIAVSIVLTTNLLVSYAQYSYSYSAIYLK